MIEPTIAHIYDDKGQIYTPIVIIRCPCCNHQTAVNEKSIHYEKWVKSYRAMFNKLGTENTELKNKVKYLEHELQQFKKACH